MTAFAPVQTVPPTGLPVSIFEARAHLRVDGTDEDELIAALIEAAVDHLDGWSGILGRCIMAQTWRQDFDCFEGCIRLPFPDVQSVTVQYYDTANTLQTVSATNYYLVNRVDGSRIEISPYSVWPVTALRPDAVRVTMVCGYTTVPASLKAAILLHIGALYVNRESVSETSLLPFAYDALVQKHRMVGT